MSISSKKFYITTSIAYTNAPPHIGFALELVQADVLARYHRLLGDDVFFSTGTDEHGFKIAEAAEKEGKKPEVFVDEISGKFKELANVLNLSNDDFIRTTDKKRHWPSVEKVWLKLKESGDIYKKKYRGCYCPGCEAFITEKDLVGGKCSIHQKELEIIEEENYFFRLSKYSKEIKSAIEKDELKIIPQARKNEILSFIKSRLEDVSFSRVREKLSWGIPVPDDPSQTIYVWVDALTNYISALGYAENGLRFKKYWPADIQVVGKDILRFHSVIWPAMLLSLGLKLPKTIFVHGFITADGQKMSKSLGNVIDPFELVRKYGVDAVRYFLLREIPPTEDGDFTIEKFVRSYNDDLLKGLGNLLSRILQLVQDNFNNRVPIVNLEKTGKRIKINNIFHVGWEASLEDSWGLFNKFLENFEFDKCLKLVFSAKSAIEKEEAGLIPGLNRYIDYCKPWDLVKRDKDMSSIIIYDVLESLRHIGLMLLPFLPETADKIFNQLGLDLTQEKKREFEEVIKWGGLKPGTKIKKGSHLFEKFI